MKITEERIRRVLAERLPCGAADAQLIRDLQRMAEIHGFLGGTGSLAALSALLGARDDVDAAFAAGRAPWAS